MGKSFCIKPIYSKSGIDLYHGDCNQVLKALSVEKGLEIASVVTSPPYANQRDSEYQGIDSSDYPNFTHAYFERIRPLLSDRGSIFLVVRPNIKEGIIDDFVLRTRLKLRDNWAECEELIWIKPNSAPIGSTQRPRRSWESILWFGKTGKVYCNTKAGNIVSNRIGFEGRKFASGDSFLNKGQNKSKNGIARDSDFISVGTQKNEKGINHPAIFPVEIPQWLIKLSTSSGQIVLDPFMGSGTTAVACIRNGRRFIGIEKDIYFINEAVQRIERAFDQTHLKKRLFSEQQSFFSPTVIRNTIISF